ncbi:hypothetical protein [Pontibacter sp. HSC-14F20]|nr:hypothetical protein [Pontibacter sp. HSC-14F20]
MQHTSFSLNSRSFASPLAAFSTLAPLIPLQLLQNWVLLVCPPE